MQTYAGITAQKMGGYLLHYAVLSTVRLGAFLGSQIRADMLPIIQKF